MAKPHLIKIIFKSGAVQYLECNSFTCIAKNSKLSEVNWQYEIKDRNVRDMLYLDLEEVVAVFQVEKRD